MRRKSQGLWLVRWSFGVTRSFIARDEDHADQVVSSLVAKGFRAWKEER
jgi:hypothetical protein